MRAARNGSRSEVRARHNSSPLTVGVSAVSARLEKKTATVGEERCVERVLSTSRVDPLECVAVVRINNENQWSRSLAANVERARRMALRRTIERVVSNGAQRFRPAASGGLCCLVCGLPPSSCMCTVATIRRYVSSLLASPHYTTADLMDHLARFGADRRLITTAYTDLCMLALEHMEWAAWSTFQRVVADRLRGSLMLELLAHRHSQHQNEPCCICGTSGLPCECTSDSLGDVVDRWIANSPNAGLYRKLLLVEPH